MAKTIVALYDDVGSARQAIQALTDAGFERDRISVIAQESTTGYRQTTSQGVKEHTHGASASVDRRDHMEKEQMKDGAAKGAGVGAALGGVAGLLVGLGVLAVPGVGPVLAAGPLAGLLAGAGIGAAAGGLVGALVNRGIPEHEARLYEEGVRRGGTLVTLSAPENRVHQAVEIMERFDPVDIHERSTAWKDEGWAPYTHTAGVRPETEGRATAESLPDAGRHHTNDINWLGANRDGSGRSTTDPARPSYETGDVPISRAAGERREDHMANKRHDEDRIVGTSGYAPAVGTGKGGDKAGTEAPRRFGDKAEDQIGGQFGQDRSRTDTGSMGATGGQRNLTSDRDTAFSAGSTSNQRLSGTDTGGTFRRDETILPVVEEEIDVSKRAKTEGGVRVRTYVEEKPVHETVNLREEHVHAERRPASGSMATNQDFAFTEGVMEFPERHEEAIVRKQAKVVEEVVVSKDVRQHTERVDDTVRKSHVEVEKMGTEKWQDTGYDSYDSRFRQHFDTHFAGRGHYDEYSSAYRHGYDMALRDSDRDWNAMERDTRTNWESRQPGTWDRFKDAIRHGFDSVRSSGTQQPARTGSPNVNSTTDLPKYPRR